jgi:outer membrane autotransporter protein
LNALAAAMAAFISAHPAQAQNVIVTGSETVIGDGSGTQASPWNINGFLQVGNINFAGAVDIIALGLVTSQGGRIGRNAAEGRVTVDGGGVIEGAGWVNQAGAEGDGSLYIGDGANGALNVVNGGVVLNTASVIGFEAGSEGTVIVRSSGSSWRVDGSLIAGYRGTGQLNIEDGGVVTSNLTDIGGLAGASGAATVTGADSLWLISGDLRVGREAQGALIIENGGAVSNSGVGIIGDDAAAQGDVTVRGAGSQWGSNSLTVGRQGTGSLTIENGGAVFNTLGVIGDGASSDGRVIVDGAGSSWTNTDRLVVGNSGSGRLVIRNGGVVSASPAQEVDVGSNGGQGGIIIGGLIAGQGRQAPGTLDAPSVNLRQPTSALEFNHTGTDYTFAPEIRGSGAVRHIAGTTVLTGQSVLFGGSTIVTGGILRVNGWLEGSTRVSGGILSGTGTLGNTRVEAGGTAAPGNSIGTLNVNNISFAPDSTYQVEVNAAGDADLIAAAGEAAIAGGTVAVLAEAGDYAPSTSYTILTAAGGVSGEFDSVTSNLAFLQPSLTYNPGRVVLTLMRNEVEFDALVGTFNQNAAGAGVAGLGAGAIQNALLGLAPEQALAAYDQLSGEIHASAKTALIEDSRFVREAAFDRLRAGGCGDCQTTQAAAWMRAFGSWGHTNGDGNAARLDRSTSGVFLGVDGELGAGWRVGALTGFSQSDFKARQRNSSGKSDNFHLGVYAGGQWDGYALRAGVAYTRHDLSTSRSVTIQGFSDSLKGEYHARTAQVFGEAGYGLQAGSVRVEPFVNLAYVKVHTAAYTESGNGAALSGRGGSGGATFSTLGLHASTELEMGGARVTAKGTLGWRHVFGNATPKTQLAFAGGEAFTVAGVPIAKNAAVLDAGLDFAIGKNTTLGASYNGQLGSRANDHSARATLAAKF